MKNLKNQIKSTVSKIVGEAAIKLGDFEGGSALLIIDEPRMPNEILKERTKKYL